MLVLITYDVNTQDAQGSRRLRKVAKVCVNYGQRVQNSVFECLLSPAELCIVKSQLLKAMDEQKDSLRIYNLGSSYKTRIEHYGAKQTYSPEDPIII
ncbi:CRISPR-associated endonuclease Cas2 [Oscillibacter sp. GMB15532]|uniref:CRISPR-associated endonuclease Cas2 n=1 Tax=Oscillibacter sp. GMB15532 TaxID=3230022 RepID=UPI0034DE28B5